jgi:nucleoside-diphosphate-sugar epimerase
MKVFAFGLGATLSRLAQSAGACGLHLAGTVRSPEKARQLRQAGIAAYVFDSANPGLDDAALADLHASDAVIAGVPPPADGSIIGLLRTQDCSLKLRRIVYLSSSAVYGDRDGARVDFTMAAAPSGPRGAARLAAEAAWQAFAAEIGASSVAVRIAGIYGPGRNALVGLRRGTAKRIIKPGHAFNRIHVDDLVRIIAAATTTFAAVLCDAADDEAAPQADVVAHAARLLNLDVPPAVPFDAAELSAAALGFWSENKRIDNRASKQMLGVKLKFPTYREGLEALLADGEGAT